MDRNMLKKREAGASINNWETREFALIAHKSKKKINPKKESDNAICIELEHISKESGSLLDSTSSNLQRSTKNVFKKGNVLFGKLRPNLRKYLFCEFDGVCSSEIWVLEAKQGIYPKFLFYLVQQDRFISSACVVSGSKMPRADWDYVSRVSFQVPSLPEQQAIAETLQTWDTAIEKTEKLITEKEKQFEWLVRNLINKSGYTIKQLSNFISEVSKRNRKGKIDQVLSVTNHRGFVLPEDQFKRRVASVDLSNYKIVRKGEYAYNPSRINVGSIARLDLWEIGVLSPMYIVFKLDDKVANSDYFLHWLSSSEAKQRIRIKAQGSVRETVGFEDLTSIPIALPNVKTQGHVAKTLNAARHEIGLLKSCVRHRRMQKHGLMQKLLTGEWRVKE